MSTPNVSGKGSWWEVGSEKWEVGSGKWEVGSGKARCDRAPDGATGFRVGVSPMVLKFSQSG